MLPCLSILLSLFAPPQISPAEICSRFEAYDHDRDGQIEIAALTPLAFGSDSPATEPTPADRRLILVFVEHRLLEERAGGAALRPHLTRLQEDLTSEGHETLTLGITFAKSERHQDGRFVLALREVLRAFDGDGRLDGALLVGHFPDAYLVRTCNWRRKGDITLHQGKEKETAHVGKHFLRRVPEHVSQRADIVLADLDGHWENLYVQPRSRLQSTLAVFDGEIPDAGGVCVDLERGSEVFEDYFHISDGKLEIQELCPEEDPEGGPGVEPEEGEPLPPRFRVFLDDRSGDHECSPDDARHPNVIAHPDILVSRIDAWGTAHSPRADLRDARGQGLLDEAGRPRTLTFTEGEAVPDWQTGVWSPDPALEQRLIAAYLDRNHAFRIGEAKVAWRPSSIAFDLGSGYDAVAQAAPTWSAGSPALGDIHGQPSLERFVDWMNYPAVLRTIRAHSNATISVFGKPEISELETLAGGTLWSWTPRGQRLVPSLEAACKDGHLNWFLLRTLWENGAQASEPCFYLHTGCEAISPPNSRSLPFTAPSYGARQGAEALLLMGQGLALLGRAKVFYDEPRGFAQVLGNGETLGAAWARYFDLESRSTWAEAGGDIGRKRSYFWSVLGDWTLGLSMAKPKAAVASPTIDTSGWESAELANSQLYFPADLDLSEGDRVPLYIHFQGGLSAARRNFARMERRGVLLASTLSGFSSAFRVPYEDPAAFGQLLDSVDAALSERAGRPVRSGPVVITFFSAGYGAVREFLKHPEHFDRIDGLVSADSIYASVVGDEVRAPEASQMVDFQRFAQAAARGEKTFVLVHGMYQTPYASTAECADAILSSVAGTRVPKEWTNERGFTTASEAHVGNLHLYTFDVAEPHIHVECMQMIPELVRRHL